jgi:hypothetical protein
MRGWPVWSSLPPKTRSRADPTFMATPRAATHTNRGVGEKAVVGEVEVAAARSSGKAEWVR